jgi:Domain of unknown function (DUF4167)
MRQGQQHRRGRTRGGHSGGNNHNTNANNNNNNRKGQNPISRNYQSNGPEGKVSGTASGIAEKYLSLARDAVTSGDPVLAENYLQHAEHYNRIILAYRETLNQGQDDGAGGQRPRSSGEDALGEGADDAIESYGRDMQPLPPLEPQVRQHPAEPRQNQHEGRPQENKGGEPQPRFADQGRFEGQRPDDRQPRFNDQNRRPQRDRFERDRFGGERGDRNGNDRGERFNTGERNFNGDRQNGGRNDRNQDRQPGERFQNDRPYAERGNQDRNQQDRPHQDRPQQDRPYQERGQQDRAHQDRQPGDRPPQGDRSFRDRDQNRDQPRFDGPPRDVAAREPVPQPRDVMPREPVQPRLDAPERIVEPRRVDPSPLVVPFVEPPTSPVQIADVPAPRAAPRRRERAVVPALDASEQPEFLRRPVRRPRKEVASEDAPAPSVVDREPKDD